MIQTRNIVTPNEPHDPWSGAPNYLTRLYPPPRSTISVRTSSLYKVNYHQIPAIQAQARVMSYPPKIYGEQDDLGQDDQEGLRARSPVPSVTERKDQDEEELNAVRRYEDFTTVGTWLESRGVILSGTWC